MINSVVLVGRLTRDVELKKTRNNLSVATFTLACDRRYSKNQGDNSGQTADFISCVAWRQQAEFLGNYGRKGNLVAVEGRISTRSYDGQDGRKVYVTEVTCDSVQLLTPRSERSEAPAPVQSSNSYNNSYNTFTPSSEPSYMNDMNDDFDNTPSLDISSDDLPFY